MIDIVLHVEGKTFPANKQGNLLKGIVNWSGAARSVVQGPKQSLWKQFLSNIFK